MADSVDDEAEISVKPVDSRSVFFQISVARLSCHLGKTYHDHKNMCCQDVRPKRSDMLIRNDYCTRLNQQVF
jgi:hypothetical protein